MAADPRGILPTASSLSRTHSTTSWFESPHGYSPNSWVSSVSVVRTVHTAGASLGTDLHYRATSNVVTVENRNFPIISSGPVHTRGYSGSKIRGFVLRSCTRRRSCFFLRRLRHPGQHLADFLYLRSAGPDVVRPASLHNARFAAYKALRAVQIQKMGKFTRKGSSS